MGDIFHSHVHMKKITIFLHSLICTYSFWKKTKAAAFEVYVSLNSVMLQSALIYLFCYHSSLVSHRMGQVAHFSYSTTWYNFPIKTQKQILLMIQRSNVRFVYTGLGIFQCDLQTLSMVKASHQYICSITSPHMVFFLFCFVCLLTLDRQFSGVILPTSQKNLKAETL